MYAYHIIENTIQPYLTMFVDLGVLGDNALRLLIAYQQIIHMSGLYPCSEPASFSFFARSWHFCTSALFLYCSFRVQNLVNQSFWLALSINSKNQILSGR